MIARRLEPALDRPLSVLIDLDADGTGKIITDAADNVEYREALARLRRWIDRGAVDALLAELGEGGARHA